jgi:hypothetical protein
MSKASDSGKSFMAGVLAKLPDALRAQAETIFNAAEAEVALEVVGTGALAQPEINRKLDEIATQDRDLKEKLAAATNLYERNDAWFKTNEAALKEYPTLKSELDRLKAGGDGDGGDPPKPVTLDKKTIEDTIREMMDPLLSERERGYVDVVAFMQDTGGAHLKLFGELPSMRELTANPKLGKPIIGQPGRVFSLQDAYNEKYGGLVQAKAKETHDKEIEAEVQKRLGEERSKNGGQPFPIRGQAPSVLDVLDTKEGAAAHTLDTAVAAYETLQAGRGL